MKKERVKQPSKARSRMREIKRNGLLVNTLGIIPFVWASILLFILLWGLEVAFADPNWYLAHNKSLLVEKFTLKNFGEAFRNFKQQISTSDGGFRWVGYGEMTLNTIWYSFGYTFTKMFSTVCAAYAVARFDFPGRKWIHRFVIVQLMIPVYGQTAASYSLLMKMGLVDSPLFLLSTFAGHGMNFLIMYSFFRNLPSGYEEAAKMDGAGPFTIFSKVMLPLAKPIILAYTIMLLIGYWNEYEGVLIYLPSFPTLSSALYTIRSNAFYLGLQTPAYFAGIFVSVIPVATVFIIFNKQIMSNVTIGGLKG